MKVLDIAHHRNGVSGIPFWLVRFVAEDEELVAVMPTEYADGGGSFPECFVFSAERAAFGDIAFGSNSYRGDRFAGPIRRAIQEHERTQCLAFETDYIAREWRDLSLST